MFLLLMVVEIGGLVLQVRNLSISGSLSPGTKIAKKQKR